MNWKSCTKCYTNKPINQFSKDKNGSDGHRANCKQCQNTQNQECRTRRTAKQHDSHSGTHCHWCDTPLSRSRIDSEALRRKTAKAAYGETGQPASCESCQYLPPQQRYEMRHRHHPPQRKIMDAMQQAEHDRTYGKRTTPHRLQPPPDPLAS